MDLAVFLATAGAITKVVDTVRNIVGEGVRVPKATWNLLAFGCGVGAAYAFNLNYLPGQEIGTLLTGLALGGGSSGVHELYDYFSSKAKEATSASLAPIEPGDGPKGV